MNKKNIFGITLKPTNPNEKKSFYVNDNPINVNLRNANIEKEENKKGEIKIQFKKALIRIKKEEKKGEEKEEKNRIY
jgi:membrane carboxypeptidase/penicillin-binding protein PbpC